MTPDCDDFRAAKDKKIHLRDWPTEVKKIYRSKKHYEEILADHVDRLDKLQRLLYASNRYAVLIIFQAMDAAGKDGAIRHVMSGVNPQGCQVFSFKKPSAEELDHTIQKLSTMRNGLRHAAACRAPSHMECPTFRRILRSAAAGALEQGRARARRPRAVPR